MDPTVQFSVNQNSSDREGSMTPSYSCETSKGIREVDFLGLSKQDNGSGGSTSFSSIGDDLVCRLRARAAELIEDNQRLEGMLSQVASDTTSLLTQLTLAKKQNNEAGLDSAKSRRFLDLGLGGAYGEHNVDDNSAKFSEERSQDRLRSLPTSNEEVRMNSMDDQDAENVGKRSNDRLVRVTNPNQEESTWIRSSKIPRVSPPRDEQAIEATMRKARVSVRARSQATTIVDGCNWRKYGQKIAKGNPSPKAYFRCTMSEKCTVRKQVQRCATDKTVLVTTYEGHHDHSLPPAAMPMASTTSAAVKTLLSGSTTSSQGLLSTSLLMPCGSIASLSASAPFPTITLDLTENLEIPPSMTQHAIPFLNPNQNFPDPSNLLPQLFAQTQFNPQKFPGLETASQDSKATELNQPSMPAQVESLTAALTSDPNFTNALAAAIATFMGGAGPQNNSNSPPGNNTTIDNSKNTN